MKNKYGFVKVIIFIIIISLIAFSFVKNGFTNTNALESSINKKEFTPAKRSEDKQYKIRNISITSVPPSEMYRAFMTQYSLNPDKRFIKSFSVICDLYWKYQNKADSPNPYHIGELEYINNDVLIPIMKDRQELDNITLSLPLKSDQILKSLNECLDILNGLSDKTLFDDLDEPAQKSLKKSIKNFQTMDPRWITLGLIQLQNLFNENPHPRILVAASTGYSALLFNYYLSSLENADPFAAYSLGLLAFSRWLDPSLSSQTIVEEALLAFQMDYRNHVDQLLKSEREDQPGLHEQILNVYLKGDFKKLKAIQEENPDEFLSSYLLAYLYRQMGLFELSEEQLRDLWAKFPNLSLTAIEGIHSLDLHETKRLTIIYPLTILDFIEHEVNEEDMIEQKTWEERIKTFYGKETSVDVSLSKFDRYLQKWNPLGQGKEKGNSIIVDEQKIKKMHKALYEEAVYFRFHLLLEQWAVIDFARQYLDNFITQDGQHPLLLRMQLELKSKVADYKEVDQFCVKVINDPQTSGPIASNAFSKLSNILSKLKYAPQVTKKLDTRPFHLYHRGFMFQNLYNYDMAEEAYRTGLSLNKYEFLFYKHLAQVTKEHTPIYKAVDEFPLNFKVMKKSGEYMAKQNDDDSLSKALEYYKAASLIVPEEKTLSPKIAKVLTKLKRYQEAIDMLNLWIEDHGSNDLTLSIRKGQVAYSYLKMGEPDNALEILMADGIDRYQAGIIAKLADTYEALGQLEEAENQWKKALNRYPSIIWIKEDTAGFYWRQGKDQEAAKYISDGRKLSKQFSRWYFNTFRTIFEKESEERITNAVAELLIAGATPGEVSSLGILFQYDRPEIAFNLIQKASARGMMPFLEKQVSLYKVQKKWKGEKEAFVYLKKSVRPNQMGPLSTVLFKHGLFKEILMVLDDVEATCPKSHVEFCLLQKLMAWLALEKNPGDLEETFRAHYNGRSSDYYHSIGRFMLGILTQEELLSLVKNKKQRCEFSYYIGFSERLKENFAKATSWYHICRETLLSNNGEFHWASDEMFWWAHMGLNNRHRLVNDDIDQYHQKEKRGQISP